MTFTATTSQPLDGTGLWVEIFETTNGGSTSYLGWCNSGTTCTKGPVTPHATQGKFVAVLGNTLPNTYAQYPAANKWAESPMVLPPPWTISMSASVGSTIGLTATSNYAVGNGAYIEVFDSTLVANTTYLGWCGSGTTCSFTTVPKTKQSTYIAVAGYSLSNTYPSYSASATMATSPPVTPPAWAVTLRSSGSTLTATTNYDLFSAEYTEVFDETSTSNVTYLGWCHSGTQCSFSVGNSGHQYLATVGSISNTPIPSPTFAVSNSVGVAGPTAAYETSGGSSLAGMDACYVCSGDPVNTLTGEFFERATDVAVQGRGPSLDVTRTYSSQRAAYDGPLGTGWAFAYGMSLASDPTTGAVTIQQENGSNITFTNTSSGTYVAPTRLFATLTANPDGTWTYVRKAREIFVFTASGRLQAIRDLNGETIALTYNTDGTLAAATDAAGRSLSFTYTSGRIRAVTDPSGHSTAYGYDSSGHLISVTNADGALTRYGYDDWGLLTSVTDPDGNVTTNTYSSSQRVTSQTDPAGGVTTFAYGGDGTTTVTSPDGRVTTHLYASGAQTTQVSGAGTASAATTRYTYDPATLAIATVTDPDGHVTTYTTDTQGNRTSTKDALGDTASWQYDSLDDLTSTTDAAGRTTTYTYDGQGNLLSVSRPVTETGQTQTTTYTRSSAHPGDVTAVTDPNGKTSIRTYNADGTLHSVQDPLGHTTTYTYDAMGRPVSVTTPRGSVTSTSYDAMGRTTATTNALGQVTSYTLDTAGRRTAATDLAGGVTHYAYDARGLVTQITRPDGTTSTFTYDHDGHELTGADGAGNVTTYTYDALGRISAATDPLNWTTNYGHDAAGNLTTIKDPAGRTTTNGYNAVNLKTGTTYSDGATAAATFGYDPDGRQVSMRDGTGTTTTSYDSLGRLAQQTNGGGQTVVYGYDLDNQLTALTYPNGQHVDRGYDDAGRLHTVTDWLGHTTTINADDDGNATSTTWGNGVTSTATFDATNAITAIGIKGPTGASLATLDYTRNSGQLTAASATRLPDTGNHTYTYTANSQLSGDNSTTYGYTPAGDLSSIGGDTLTYDAANELASYTPAGGATTSLTYDSSGNRLTGPDPAGATATYSYDQAGHLTTTAVAGTSSSATYDAAGLRATRTAGSITQHFAWAALAAPLLLTDGANSYLYDDQGQPIEQVDQTGAAQYFQHDQLGSTVVLTDGTGAAVATFSYDPHGNLTGHTGAADTPLRWNGQYQDAGTGLYYLRARYYDPFTAQFLSRDPLVSLTRAPYSYANQDPLSEADPTGLITIGPCLSGSAGAMLGGFLQACLVIGVDDRTGDISVGSTETIGGGGQTPEANLQLSAQASTARNVQQLGGPFGYGGLSGDLGFSGGLGVFGGQSCGAPGGAVLGAEVGGGVGLAPVAEVHGGVSYTWTQTFLSLSPSALLKELL
ncbi:RHS repeat-associated core domain-containing protein [Oryzihumus leptocrescens]